MKSFKQLYSESINAPVYNLNPDSGEDFFDVQNNYISDFDFILNLKHKKIAPLIYQHGTKVFTVNIDGIDPDVDGSESYYTVTDPQALKNIASAVYKSDPETYEEIATDIGTGKLKDFMLHLTKKGFTGEQFGKMKVFFIEPGGLKVIQSFFQKNNLR